MTTTGNQAWDALADSIAARVIEKIEAAKRTTETRMLDVPAAAAYIGRSAPAVRRLEAKREIPSSRRGRRVLFDREDLDRWIQQGKTK